MTPLKQEHEDATISKKVKKEKKKKKSRKQEQHDEDERKKESSPPGGNEVNNKKKKKAKKSQKGDREEQSKKVRKKRRDIICEENAISSSIKRRKIDDDCEEQQKRVDKQNQINNIPKPQTSSIKNNQLQLLPFAHGHVLAPMVGASELAFRLLCRKYGATLAYTPMMSSTKFASCSNYRREEFQTIPEDRPLVCHFSANNPSEFASAAKLVEDRCDAIDLNLGCPQRTAYVGHFGSYLLGPEDRELVVNIVRAGAQAVSIPIFCKIRLLDKIEDTIELCKQLRDAGASLIAIHGRYRASFERDGPGARDGPAMLDQIRDVKAAMGGNYPILTNGNVITYEDVVNNQLFTSADGVMSAEGILDNPALFLPRYFHDKHDDIDADADADADTDADADADADDHEEDRFHQTVSNNTVISRPKKYKQTKASLQLNVAKTRKYSRDSQSHTNLNNTLRHKRHRSSSHSSNSSHDSLSSSSSSSSHKIRHKRKRRHDGRNSYSGNSTSTSSSDSDDNSSDTSDQDKQSITNKHKHSKTQFIEISKQLPTTTQKNHSSTYKEPSLKSTCPRRQKKFKNSNTTSEHSSTSSQSSSSSNSSSESSDSSDSSTDDENNEHDFNMVKPIFVPKFKRIQKSKEEQQNQDMLKELEYQKQKETKVRISRALVAQVVAYEKKNSPEQTLMHGGDQNEFDETGGSTVPPPDDNDDISDKETMKRREAWEVRELLRILRDYDTRINIYLEQEDIKKRRNMTDKEIVQKDVADGRYRKPGIQRQNQKNGEHKSDNNYMQRYFHRGAFYLDEDTLAEDKDDVRHKAAIYAKAKTGEDKIDKKAMPEIMQVKKFGFAGYSTKYKGLAKEDTTDKTLSFLPLKKIQKKKSLYWKNGTAERETR